MKCPLLWKPWNLFKRGLYPDWFRLGWPNKMSELLTQSICSLSRVCVQISARWQATTASRQWSWTRACWGSWRSSWRPKQSTCTRPWRCTRTPRCCPACRWSPTFTGCSAARPCWDPWPCSSRSKVSLQLWAAPSPAQGSVPCVAGVWALVVWGLCTGVFLLCYKKTVGISETFFLRGKCPVVLTLSPGQ